MFADVIRDTDSQLGIRSPEAMTSPRCVSALPLPVTPEGLHGTVLCVACGHFGLGIEHPEWCAWEVLKERPSVRSTALARVELGDRAAAALTPTTRQGCSSF